MSHVAPGAFRGSPASARGSRHRSSLHLARPEAPGRTPDPGVAGTPGAPVPLLIGVTGHRDLREADVDALKDAVRRVLAHLRDGHRHTPLLVLSPLAEGADHLVAEVALEMGLRVAAPLPMPAAQYEADFTSPEAREAFRGWLEAVPSWPIAGGPGPDESLDGEAERRRCYRRVGGYLAANCPVLIALWDGEDAAGIGGTAEVVRAKRTGIPPASCGPGDPCDWPEAGIVYHIVSPRSDDPGPTLAVAEVRVLRGSDAAEMHAAPGTYDRQLARLDRFNSDLLSAPPRRRSAIDDCRDRLIPPADRAGLSREALADLERFAAADALAVAARRRMEAFLWTLLALALGWALAHLGHEALEGAGDALRVRGARALCIAAYYGTLLGSLGCLLSQRAWFDDHGRHLDYRALAEALRVRLFWRIAGVEAPVADLFLRTHRSDLDWLRHALRAALLADGVPAGTEEVRPPASLIRSRWLDDQVAFFERQARWNLRRSRLLGALSRHISYPAFIALALARPLIPSPWLGVLTVPLAVAAVVAMYGRVEAFSEHSRQYARMAHLFARIRGRLEAIPPGDRADEARALLEALGREALAEAGDWLLIHRDRPLEFPRA